MKHARALPILAASVVTVLAVVGCGGSGPSQSDVDDAIAEALATLEPAGDPGSITETELEQSVIAVIEKLGQPETVTVAQVEELIRRALDEESDLRAADMSQALDEQPADLVEMRLEDPRQYTRHLVSSAIAMYNEIGLAETLAHVNDPANIDGQWYVFVVDRNGDIAGHHDPSRRGLPVIGWVGTDINGYNFGPQLLDAGEDGRWVPFVYKNPASGALNDDQAFQLKSTWVVRHDGLLFASGWHIDTDSFLPELIAAAADHFREGGLEAMLEFYNDPQGISAGLIPTVEYYNSTDTLDGKFSGIVAGPDGVIQAHFDPALIGTDIEDLLGPAHRKATPEGTWITADDNESVEGAPESMRIWAVDVEGTFIGGGWYRSAAD